MPSTTEPTPQQRLAASRKAIVRHMAHEADASGPGDGRRADGSAGAASPSGGTWGFLKHTLSSWWHHHPASMAAELAQPVVARYAQENPLKLLGIAAAVGAAAVVLRPWRLISVGGLLLAALKSSELSAAVLSMLSGAARNDETSHTAP